MRKGTGHTVGVYRHWHRGVDTEIVLLPRDPTSVKLEVESRAVNVYSMYIAIATQSVQSVHAEDVSDLGVAVRTAQWRYSP